MIVVNRLKISIFAVVSKFVEYIYNPETMLYEAVGVPGWQVWLRRLVLVFGAVAMGFLYFWIYTDVLGFDLPKTARLKKKNAEWVARMEILDRQVDLYDETLTGLEDRDDNVWRSIFGLTVIPDEVKNSGFGGLNRYEWLEEAGAAPELKAMMERLDVMTKRTYIQSKALDEVSLVSRTAGDMVSCVPAVPPILPKTGTYHISSYFGYRTDPVFGGRRFHEGIDFASDIGNPVYVTGDGVVEKVNIQFRGYGNEVVVNHGFGYKTRYAHLNTVDVAPGMHLKRGDRIGEVGKTGKSTGPHLHYEVVYRGAQVNPMHYLDMSMSVDEYKAMVDRPDSPSAQARKKKPSNSELLRRRR